MLDEPSSALDARHAKMLASALRELKTRGVTIVFATHSLGFADSIADQLLFIDKGRAIARGDWRDLGKRKEEQIRTYLEINAYEISG